jgi:hypothetical protein
VGAGWAGIGGTIGIGFGAGSAGCLGGGVGVFIGGFGRSSMVVAGALAFWASLASIK